MEQAVSVKGKPAARSEVADSEDSEGERLQKEKAKKSRGSVKELSSDDRPNGDLRLKGRKRIKERARRASSSSDSYSTEDSDSDSDSSDSGSDSYSSSSDTSSSSDYRRKRKRKISRKDRRRHGKRKKDQRRDKKRRRSYRKTRRSRRSYDSSDSSTNSSDSMSESSSDMLKRGVQEVKKPLGGKREALTPISKKESFDQHPKEDQQETEDGEFFQEHGAIPEEEIRLESPRKPFSDSDDKVETSRDPVKKTEDSGYPVINSSRQQSNRKNWEPKDDGGSPQGNISKYGNAPAHASDNGQAANGSPPGSSNPKRVRKGRGFTDRYSYARKYRTPSPDLPEHYRDRNDFRDRDRYPRYRSYTDRRGTEHYRDASRNRSPPRS